MTRRIRLDASTPPSSPPDQADPSNQDPPPPQPQNPPRDRTGPRQAYPFHDGRQQALRPLPAT